MSEDKTNLNELNEEVDLGFEIKKDINEEIEDVESKVNISSLDKDRRIDFKAHDDLKAAEYESKLSQLDKLNKMAFMDKKNSFDRKDFSPIAIFLIIGVMYVCWVIFPEFIYAKYINNPFNAEKFGPVGKEVLLKLIGFARLLGPVLSFYLYRKYPLLTNSKYEIIVDYQFIYGPREIKYTSLMERVKVRWEDIYEIKYDNKHKINHIRCFNKSSRDVLAIRLDIKNFDKLKKLVVEYTDIDHPLHKIFC